MKVASRSHLLATGLLLSAAALSLALPRPGHAQVEGFVAQRIQCAGDVRKPIQSLPFTITSCGSYYLTKCLTGVSGQNGITIDADDVTLDLDGWSLLGVSGSLDGIHVVGGDRRGILVHAGVIRGWGGDGVDAGSGTSFTNEITLRDLTVLENGVHGITTGSECTVLACSSNGNALDAIRVGGGSKVRDSICRDNGRHGITTENDCLIEENHVDDHCSGSGILVTSGDTVVQRNTVGDCMKGIEVTAAGNLIVRNQVSDSTCGGTKYSVAGGNQLGTVSSDPTTAGPWANFDF